MTIPSVHVLFIASCFVDYTGYIIHVFPVVSGNSKNPYFTIKLKVDVYKYESVRVMLFKSSATAPVLLKSKRQNAVPITLKKGATTSYGVKFYNSNRGILVVDTLNAVTSK